MDSLNHPSEERLHGFVEGSLGPGEAGALDRHLATCAGCRSQVEELRALFAAFSTLPVLAPSAGFANRVMAGVRVRRPALALAEARAAEWARGCGQSLERLAPTTTRGWAAATAVLALPLIGATLLAWWILSHPGVTPQSLWLVAGSVVADGAGATWDWVLARAAESTLALYALRAVELARAIGTGGLGLAAVGFATAMAASLYVLYQNLFRPVARRTEHVPYLL